jgi:hypothetical protein
MHLAVVVPGHTPALDQKHPALSVVSLPRFLYLANYHLDSGLSAEDTAKQMQVSFHDTFNKNFRRAVKASDVLLARDVLRHRVPSPVLRFDMARWALTLSQEFRRMAGFVTRNAPRFNEEEARLMSENFSGFLSKRSFASGYVFKGSITPAEIESSFVLYPEGAQGPIPNAFTTPEAAVYEWCRLIPYQQRDRSLTAYAKYFGDEALVDSLFNRCREACAAPLPSFMTDEQKRHHEQMGVECFWTVVEYINWLTNHNPVDGR